MDLGNCDLIEQLLQSTGLSCEDLLHKLQTYRAVKSKPTEPENKTSTKESEYTVSASGSSSSLSYNSLSNKETKQNVSSNDISVILETKSSKVDDNENNVRTEREIGVKGSPTLPVEAANPRSLQKSEGIQRQSICDIIIAKISTEEQETNSFQTQSEKAHLEDYSKSSFKLNAKRSLQKTLKRDSSTPSEDVHPKLLSSEAEERENKLHNKTANSFHTESEQVHFENLAKSSTDLSTRCSLQATLEDSTSLNCNNSANSVRTQYKKDLSKPSVDRNSERTSQKPLKENFKACKNDHLRLLSFETEKRDRETQYKTANSFQAQSEKVDLQEPSECCIDFDGKSTLQMALKENCNTLSKDDHSPLSPTSSSEKLLVNSEKCTNEASAKEVNIVHSTHVTPQQNAENEECHFDTEVGGSKFFSKVRKRHDQKERNNDETETDSVNNILISSHNPEETCIGTSKRAPSCLFTPAKGVSNIVDDLSKSSSENYKQDDYETVSESNNKIPTSSRDSEENFSHASAGYQKEHPIGLNDQSTSEQNTSDTMLSAEMEKENHCEVQECDNTTVNLSLDFKRISDKIAAEKKDDIFNCQSTLEKQTTDENSMLLEPHSPKLTLAIQKDVSGKSINQTTELSLDDTPNCQNIAEANSIEERCTVLKKASVSMLKSFRDTLEVNKTKESFDDSLSDSANDTNDHDYSSGEVNTASPMEAEGSLSDADNERETIQLRNNELPKSEDNLRDVLRMQLSSLRNMKKSTGLLPTFKKTMFFQSLKKKRKSCDINPVVAADVDDEKESNDKDVKEKNNDENQDNFSTNENSLISLSDNIDFVIVDVTGGVDRLTPNIESEGNDESTSASVTHNKSEDKVDKPFFSACSSSPSRNTAKTDETSNSSDNSCKNEKSPHVTVKKNMSENFTRDPGIKKSVKNSEKSPFVSDSLEDFLNESSELKISYAIPKLGAEEGITENTKKCPFDDVVNSQMPKPEQENTQKDKPKLIKAKTLAEMRRHFEKLKATEDKQVADDPPQFKRKRGFKRKFLHVEKGETSKQNQTTVEMNSMCNTTSSIPDENAPPKNSYILYNNKKIWVPSKTENRCLGNVYFQTTKDVLREKTVVPSSPKPEQISIRKPSLLSSLTRKHSRTVKYKPGPMCKKASLQNTESKAHWTTEVKTLPKIYLEVVPEVQKPIDPSIVHLLPIFEEPVITEERVNFALSALKPKNANDVQKSFNFQIPFCNKQEKIIVRKPFKPNVCKTSAEDNKTNTDEDISKVISDLITYVEIKEISDTIIKEDDSAGDAETLCESNLKTKIRKAKRRKLDLELQRLSCKVIDVATNEEDTNCTKPYCRLGCVCKSLLCESVFSNHCQLVECMFGCTCPSDISNNSLSVHTVNHLEDKAKKNLAKVEREFTQTFIHTDNDTILVGTAKVRRSSKPPKKYTDFVGDDVIFESLPPVLNEKEPLKCKTINLVLDKLLLDDVIPFCLFHNIHNCPCKGETEIVSTSKTREIDQIPKIRIVKTKEDQHKAWYDSCARIRKVFPEYKERNKTAVYQHRLRKGNLSYKGRRGPRKKRKLFAENPLEQTPETSGIAFDVINKQTPKVVGRPSKRKQSFDIREDILLPPLPAVPPATAVRSFRPILPASVNVSLTASENSQATATPEKVILKTTSDNAKEFALQRRKKKVKPNFVPVEVSVYHPIFDGEIKVSLKENRDMLNIIGNENSSLEYLRILPWEKLINSFLSGKMCIWAKDKPSSPLLCNSAGYFPPKNFVSIARVTKKSEIINWILSDTLPPDRPRELMHLILTPKNMHFLIAGYCLKKINKGSTPSEKENDSFNTWPRSVPEAPLAADPSELTTSSSPIDFADIDVESEDNTDTGTTSFESKNKDNVHSNEHFLLRDKNTEGNDTDTSVLSSPEVDISVVSDTVSPEAERLRLLNTELLKLPDHTEVPASKMLKTVARKKVTIRKTTSLTPRKGIGNRQSTTKITTKRTYVKVDSMFNTLQSVSRKNDVANVSPPTIKQVVSAPQTTLNSSSIDPLTDSGRNSRLSESLEDDESLSTLSITLNNLLESSINNMFEMDSVEVLQRKSELPSNTKGTEMSTISSASPKKSSSVTEDIAESVAASTPDDNSKNESVQKTIFDNELVSKKRPQDPLEITEVDQYPSKKSPEKQKQLPVQSNENNAKKVRKDPLEITENDSLPPKQKESSTTPVASKNENMQPAKRKTTSSNSIFNKNRITSQSGVIPSRSLKCTHKDMNNESKTLVLTNKVFNQRKLYFTQDGVKGCEITIPLPTVSRNARWRMIYLNSDFTFLTFETVNYSIKYTDLMDVVTMSSNIKSTITLRNKEFSDSYKHPLFGIYCVPDYQDRLFIGPYVPSEKHNIETLRYLQGRLIDTEIFNKMVGKDVSDKKPLWLHETPPRPISLPNGLVIDITEDDEVPEITVVDLDSDSSEETQNTSTKMQDLENSLLFPPFVEELTQAELKSRHSINRYIMTNIPHLGYFDACQRDSKAIEVFWPDGSKGYRFPNVTFAKNVLTQYLSQVFCRIPQDFKINVVIMTNLGVQINKPIDSKYFTKPGPYFCGEFGIYEKDTVPDSLLKKYNVPSIESLLLSRQDAVEDQDAIIRIFGLFLMSNEELRKHSEPYKILQWAISETYILKKLGENYESEKADLQNMISAKKQKIKEKRKETKKEETPKRQRMNVSETIEIEDSDEDDNRKTDSEIACPTFKRISISGRIDSAYDQSKSRSLLKSNVLVKPGRSLLKSKDGNTPKVPSESSIKPVKISINNSNIILKKNNLLMTKLK